MVDELQKLGVSRSAAEVFTALLQEAPCFVAPLVRTTKKHRQIIYNALEELQKKGLVRVSKRNGKNFYEVDDSGRLVGVIEQNLVLARTVEKTIAKKAVHATEHVQVFSGPTSYEHGLADFRKRAEESGEYIVIGGESTEWYEHTQRIFDAHVDDLRRLKRQGADIMILFFENERKSAETYIAPLPNNPYRCKVSPSANQLPHTAWLSGSYIYLLTPTEEPLVVRIRSTTLAKNYMDYFLAEWRKAKGL